MGIVLAVLLFSVIVIFHEFGHFILAKFNKMRVDEFCLGFGPTLVGKKFWGTKFSLKLFPFGGACVMGEDDPKDKRKDSFNNKSVWARISVIAGGPLFNFIMAVIFASLIVLWIGYDAPKIDAVDVGYSAQEQGVRAGDVVTEINGKNIHLWREVSLFNLMNTKNMPAELTLSREGREYKARITPRQKKGDAYPRLGFRSAGAYTKAGFFRSFQYGLYTLKYWVDYTFGSLKLLVTGQIGFDQISGPVGIVSAVNTIYREAQPEGLQIVLLNFFNLTVLISANLGVINLLPFPALDGGRLVFLFLEAARGKRIPPEKEGIVHFAGFAFLMILMAVVLFNDIMRLF